MLYHFDSKGYLHSRETGEAGADMFTSVCKLSIPWCVYYKKSVNMVIERKKLFMLFWDIPLRPPISLYEFEKVIVFLYWNVIVYKNAYSKKRIVVAYFVLQLQLYFKYFDLNFSSDWGRKPNCFYACTLAVLNWFNGYFSFATHEH